MAIPAIALLVGSAVLMAGQLFKPLGNSIEQWGFSIWPNNILSIADLVELLYKGIINNNTYIEYAKRLGFDQEKALQLYQSQERLLVEGDVINAWRRDIISEDQLNDILGKMHYPPETIETIKKVTWYYPAAADLVRFAVREVYSPEIAAKFGQFEDLPEKFIIEAKKSGLAEDQARNYWAAHWELPSMTQGYEMFHRRVIDAPTLDMLMRSQDVMPFWRDKLVKIAYNPLTRVDVRRMYSIGVIDEDQVYQNYLDLGYSPENAELMKKFTVKYESNDDLGLTRTTVLDAYKQELITSTEAIEYMQNLGYAEKTITLYMQLADYQKYKDEIDLYVKDIQNRYRMGEITIEEVRTLLDSLDLPASYVNSVVGKELVQSSNKTKVPSRTDIENWLDNELINEMEYKNYMSLQGYKEGDIIKYLEYFNLKRSTETRKFLPVSTYVRWYSSDIMSEGLFISTLHDMDISDRDIQDYIKEVKQLKEEKKN